MQIAAPLVLAHWLLAVGSTEFAAQGEPVAPADEPVLRIDVHISRTAHLFHVVDQISAWSPFCHSQYLAAVPDMSSEDEELLALHREIRGGHGWGGGLEQTFYTALDLEEALDLGVAKGWIDEEVAVLEAEILMHFADRVEALMEAERERLEEFAARIELGHPELQTLAARLVKLVGSTPPPVPVFLLANPSAHNFGGGFNGGRLTVEVPQAGDAYGVFLHEVFHAFLDLRMSDMAGRVRDFGGDESLLDTQTLYEGFAHALSPGILHPYGSSTDPLIGNVKRYREMGQGLSDYNLRVHLFGLALRPLMREVLDDESITFEELLERSVDIWSAMAELEQAR